MRLLLPATPPLANTCEKGWSLPEWSSDILSYREMTEHDTSKKFSVEQWSQQYKLFSLVIDSGPN